MSRLSRLTLFTLSGSAACWLSIACGGDDASGGPDGGAGRTTGTSAGAAGSPSAAGGASGAPSTPQAGQASGGAPSSSGGSAGATSTDGAGASAGRAPKGGAANGGAANGGAANGGGANGGAANGSTCSSITDFGTVSETIVVKGGETYDGKCRRYRADADKLGDGSQKEGQKPVFVVEDGGKLINVVLGAPAADGIHVEGDVTLENITWEDIGEDAMTITEEGTVTLNGGSAKNGDDKVFQINAASTFKVSNFKASNAGKFIRQNGDTTFKTEVFIDKCDISDMKESIFRTDSDSSTVSMTNTRYHAIGDSLFIGVASGNITQSNNTSY